ncbi:hypothetical protein A9G11_11990 [Gilliamella sp. wkB108]|uniref:sulfurtransferase complex subunit TusB n=1 Tax=Gilliamella sp. wkB108 TaxID=3120256 RepID=UPI00080D9D2D|nr:sulfurtransferase complex subunit TusB [Gilliamella apicola]OCG27814.1 hypothetical protein A9G11_11990 [Gilliamella apicola]
MLHTIATANQSAIDLQLISAQDVVLFWQNGVFISLKGNILLNNIIEKTNNCYILDSDINARGLSQLIDPRVKVINMKQVIALTAKYYPQMNWQS